MTNYSETILIIDDSPEILDTLSALLRSHYSVLAARKGLAGLDIATRLPKPDLILMDVLMPELDGYAILARLKENPLTRDIPVILLTSLSDPEDEERGLILGAADFVSKPIRPAILAARVKNQLEAKQTRDWLRNRNLGLEEEVARHVAENNMTQIAAIRALAHLAEIHSHETGPHFLRTQNFVWLLAELLKEHPRCAPTLTSSYIDLLTQSAALHDIGKVGIPDRVLLKGGNLNVEELEVMKTHAGLGGDAIEMVERDLARPVPFLSLAKEVARSHHENWDGSGYPDGLAGDAIPVSARLMAVADVFDELISSRRNKPAVPVEEAREIIAQGRGVRFDPDVTDAFLGSFEEFLEIVEKYPESNDASEQLCEALAL
jgi:putative two-component system response regulator